MSKYKLGSIVISTNLKYRERERQKKDKEGNRPEQLNEKKGDRQLERAIKGQTRHFFVGRTT